MYEVKGQSVAQRSLKCRFGVLNIRHSCVGVFVVMSSSSSSCLLRRHVFFVVMSSSSSMMVEKPFCIASSIRQAASQVAGLVSLQGCRRAPEWPGCPQGGDGIGLHPKKLFFPQCSLSFLGTDRADGTDSPIHPYEGIFS
jgi:hypothetical protein